jgi:hypothetical protein
LVDLIVIEKIPLKWILDKYSMEVDYLADLTINQRMLLKWALDKYSMMWTGLNCFRIAWVYMDAGKICKFCSGNT